MPGSRPRSRTPANGLRTGDDGSHSAEEVTSLTLEAGFGPEVKRRITWVPTPCPPATTTPTTAPAQKVRTLISRDFEAAFAHVDVLVSPTTPTTAFPIGERADDPMAMYLADLCTIPTNLAGNAAMSLPCGLAPEDNLPVGLQIIAPALKDDRLYKVSRRRRGRLRGKAGPPAPGGGSVAVTKTSPTKAQDFKKSKSGMYVSIATHRSSASFGVAKRDQEMHVRTGTRCDCSTRRWAARRESSHGLSPSWYRELKPAGRRRRPAGAEGRQKLTRP